MSGCKKTTQREWLLWQGGEEVEQGKGEEDTGALFSRPREENGSGQINKWGFAPGEDDTQDLNMEYKGGTFAESLQRAQKEKSWGLCKHGTKRSSGCVQRLFEASYTRLVESESR